MATWLLRQLLLPQLAVEAAAPWLHLSEDGRGGFVVPEGPRELEVGEAVSSFLMCAGKKAHTGTEEKKKKKKSSLRFVPAGRAKNTAGGKEQHWKFRKGC